MLLGASQQQCLHKHSSTKPNATRTCIIPFDVSFGLCSQQKRKNKQLRGHTDDTGNYWKDSEHPACMYSSKKNQFTRGHSLSGAVPGMDQARRATERGAHFSGCYWLHPRNRPVCCHADRTVRLCFWPLRLPIPRNTPSPWNLIFFILCGSQKPTVSSLGACSDGRFYVHHFHYEGAPKLKSYTCTCMYVYITQKHVSDASTYLFFLPDEKSEGLEVNNRNLPHKKKMKFRRISVKVPRHICSEIVSAE